MTTEEIKKFRELAKSTNATVSAAATKKLKDAGVALEEGAPADAAPAPKKESKLEKKLAAKAEKPKTTPKSAPKKEAKKSADKETDRKPTQQEIDDCVKLLKEYRSRRANTNKYKKSRKAKGLPAIKGAVEVLETAVDTAEKRISKVIKKGGLKKAETTGIKNEIADMVKVVLAGIPSKADRKQFINDLITALKKQL